MATLIHVEDVEEATLMESLGFDRARRYDYASRDGAVIVETKRRLRGVRDLRAAALQLALWLDDGEAERARLVIRELGMSTPRVEDEWRRVRGVLTPDVAERLELVAVSDDGILAIPDAPELRAFGEKLAELGVPAANTRPHDSFQVVLGILLVRWLKREGPISAKQLQEESGFSFPTIAASLRRLERHLARESDRSVSLKEFPRNAWTELLALAPRVRRPTYFEDRSGLSPNPVELFERLKRLRRDDIAVGGAIAARYWDPEFNLEGLPRLDLSVHAPRRSIDLDVVRKLDPALKETSDPRAPLALVVHAVHRATPLFTWSEADGVNWADPVETLLDLHELHLPEQADELIQRLRARA